MAGRTCTIPCNTNIIPDDDSTLPDNKQDATPTAATIVAAIPCATCGERLPQPGRLRCQECLDAEWVRRQRKGHGHGITTTH